MTITVIFNPVLWTGNLMGWLQFMEIQI